MPAILGLLGTIVTILWLLYRLAEMGIDLGGLNPFLWRRRRKWKKHYEANPIYKIDSPMEATSARKTSRPYCRFSKTNFICPRKRLSHY